MNVSKSNESSFTACGLANHVVKWREITRDPLILDSIMGYNIEFECKTFQKKVPIPIKFKKEQFEIIDNEVLDLLSKKAISVSKNESGQFISNIFIVEKKNGKYRPVIDIKKLNEFVQYRHFKMETLESVLSSIRKNSFFVSIYLKDAYLPVPVNKNDRKNLKFIWNGILYHCNALMFGLASAPRVFTKIMKPVFAYLRQQGISSFYYIDDSLIEADDFKTCKTNAYVLVDLLRNLGFSVIMEKSVLIPSTKNCYLGHIIDSVEFKVYLLMKK